MMLLAIVFLQLAYLLDYVDGALARVKKATSVFGEWLDGLVDRTKVLGWYFAFAIGYYNQDHNSDTFFLLAIFLGVKILTDYINKAFVSCFNEESTPLNTDMQQNLVKRFHFLKNIPVGIIKNPIGGGVFPVLLSIGLLTNKLLLPFYIYMAMHILNATKTVIYTFIKHKEK